MGFEFSFGILCNITNVICAFQTRIVTICSQNQLVYTNLYKMNLNIIDRGGNPWKLWREVLDLVHF